MTRKHTIWPIVVYITIVMGGFTLAMASIALHTTQWRKSCTTTYSASPRIKGQWNI